MVEAPLEIRLHKRPDAAWVRAVADLDALGVPVPLPCRPEWARHLTDAKGWLVSAHDAAGRCTAALGLEVASLLAYTVLTRVTLPPEPKLGLFTILRIQLSTKAVTNLVPGGSAAGGTLGYRLFTQAGVESTAAGFSMATVGLGSAVVLNLMLWLALLISIPINGFQPLYGTAAIVGLVIIGGAGAIVLLLMKGRDRAEQVLRAIARRMPFVEGTPPPGSSTKSPTASTSWPSSPRSSATASSGPLRTGSSMPRPCGCSSGPSANPSARST